MMTGSTGMLWQDGSSAPLTDKIKKAAEYYKTKYGRAPNLCYVHPDTAPDGTQVDGITLRADRAVAKNCLWLGVEK